MPPAPPPIPADDRESLLTRRAVALALTILAHIGLLLLLLSLAPQRVFVAVAPPAGPLTVTLNPAEEQSSASRNAAKAPAKAGAKPRATPAAAPPPTAPPPPVPLPPNPQSKALPGVLLLSKAELDAADISRLPPGEKMAGAGTGAGSGTGPADSPAAGTGRNGQPLYAAEWVREPSDAEINGYLKRGSPARGAWAEIACQTIARNRVDNCEELADSPAGSGLAYDMTQAAWQFLIRPPRVGGRALVGTWVRIHISWSREHEEKGG